MQAAADFAFNWLVLTGGFVLLLGSAVTLARGAWRWLRAPR